MALSCHTVLNSRIKGHHAYNHDYFVGKELICELEFTNKYSHNSISVTIQIQSQEQKQRCHSRSCS